MHRLAPLALVTSLFALTTGCFQGSGRLETRAFDLDGFDAVAASRAIEVEVIQGDVFAVSVTADDNLWGAVDLHRDGQTLVIGLSDAHPIYQGITMHARVTMPTLTRLDLSGGAHATLDGFDAPMPTLAVHGSGGSHVEGGANVADLSVDLSGDSHVVLDGAAETLTIDASGGSSADTFAMTSSAAAVWLSGGSHGVVSVASRLDYHLSGSSHLEYVGEPVLGAAETSGGSSASRR